MDLRTRYTALVTLTTQHVKYISDALQRLEEEEVRTVGSYIVLKEEFKTLCLSPSQFGSGQSLGLRAEGSWVLF